MTFITLHHIEQRMAEVAASYARQISLAGKTGYDPALTEFLKKDLAWLEEQKQLLLNAPLAPQQLENIGNI